MWKVISVFLGTFLPVIVYRILGYLGVALFTYVGLDALKSLIYNNISSQLGSIGSNIVGMIALVGIDHYITLIVSAYFSLFAVKATTKFLGYK